MYIAGRVRSVLKPHINSVQKCLSRNLKLVEYGEVKFEKPPFFDYYNSKFNVLKSFIDNSVKRHKENTKLFVVEGNIASGKAVVASKVAEFFGMYHFPDPTEDDIYTCFDHKPPFDLRLHNFLLPDSAKYYTGEMFWNEPDLIKKGKPLYLQYQYYIRRYWNYLKGRGIVVDRSPFSDLIMAETMFKCGFLSERAYNWFRNMHTTTIDNLWKPHLIIYIKPTKQQIRDRLQQRNIPWEMNAVNLTDKFLDTFTELMEKYYLDNMSRYSRIITLDRSKVDINNKDDMLILAHQIMDLDFVCHKALRDDYMLAEWRVGLHNDRAKITARTVFSDSDRLFRKVFNATHIPIDLNELTYAYEDHEMRTEALNLDSRTRVPPSFNTRYTSLFNIMFNPFLVKKNFAADLPKSYLWI